MCRRKRCSIVMRKGKKGKKCKSRSKRWIYAYMQYGSTERETSTKIMPSKISNGSKMRRRRIFSLKQNVDMKMKKKGKKKKEKLTSHRALFSSSLLISSLIAATPVEFGP